MNRFQPSVPPLRPEPGRAVTHGDGPRAWWRRTDLAAFAPRHADELGRVLESVSVLRLDGWPAAAHGDAAAAIKLAVGLDHAKAPLVRDLAGSALLRCAIAGDPAAKLVLDHMRRLQRDLVDGTGRT